MLKDQANKMITEKDTKTKAFFFPDHGISFDADSQEEAEKKLAEYLSKNK